MRQAVKLRTPIAWVLLLAGLGVVLYGLGSAIAELVGLYRGALNDPLAETPGGGEGAVGERMLRFALIGMAGVPALVIGSWMLGVGMVARMVRRLGDRR